MNLMYRFLLFRFVKKKKDALYLFSTKLHNQHAGKADIVKYTSVHKNQKSLTRRRWRKEL